MEKIEVEKIEGIAEMIRQRQEAVAAERDKIDDAISDLNDLRESCRKAWNSLQDARDALSELV